MTPQEAKDYYSKAIVCSDLLPPPGDTEMRKAAVLILRLLTANANLAGLLRECQWSGWSILMKEQRCPVCVELKPNGHRFDCRLAATIREQETPT